MISLRFYAAVICLVFFGIGAGAQEDIDWEDPVHRGLPIPREKLPVVFQGTTSVDHLQSLTSNSPEILRRNAGKWKADVKRYLLVEFLRRWHEPEPNSTPLMILFKIAANLAREPDREREARLAECWAQW